MCVLICVLVSWCTWCHREGEVFLVEHEEEEVAPLAAPGRRSSQEPFVLFNWSPGCHRPLPPPRPPAHLLGGGQWEGRLPARWFPGVSWDVTWDREAQATRRPGSGGAAVIGGGESEVGEERGNRPRTPADEEVE